MIPTNPMNPTTKDNTPMNPTDNTVRNRVLAAFVALLVVAAIISSNDGTKIVVAPAPAAPVATAAPAPVGTERPATTERQTTTTERPTTTTSVEQAMAEWASDNYELVAEASDLMTNISTAAGNYDTVALGAACREFGDWAYRARQLPPMPNAAANAPWQKAIDEASLSAAACVRGVENDDMQALQDTSTHIGLYAQYLEEATANL